MSIRAALQKEMSSLSQLPTPSFFPGDTRLHALVSYGYSSDEAVARLLFAVSAQQGPAALAQAVDARNEAGQAPLHLAAQCAYFRGVELLLAHGADANAQDFKGRRPAHIAALLPQHAEALLEVLAAQAQGGCDVGAADHAGYTPLHLASAVGNAPCVRALLQAGARANARAHNGDAALHMAVAAGHTEAAKALLMFGAHADVRASDGRTAIEIAEQLADAAAGAAAGGGGHGGGGMGDMGGMGGY